MELTITQNGALYALHHRASNQYRSARRKRAIAGNKIRTGHAGPENAAAQKVKTEEVCFISSGTSLSG
jgi:hypothetical protein